MCGIQPQIILYILSTNTVEVSTTILSLTCDIVNVNARQKPGDTPTFVTTLPVVNNTSSCVGVNGDSSPIDGQLPSDAEVLREAT